MATSFRLEQSRITHDRVSAMTTEGVTRFGDGEPSIPLKMIRL
jgi:hypothetical protein